MCGVEGSSFGVEKSRTGVAIEALDKHHKHSGLAIPHLLIRLFMIMTGMYGSTLDGPVRDNFAG